MADSSFSFHDAKQQLENEMTDRQLRLMSILTGQSEGLAAEKELLESEIEDRKFAIQKLEAQSCCNCCGTQADVPEAFCVRITKYGERLPTINLEMEKVCVRAECADCCNKCDSRQEPERSPATKDEIVRAIEMLSFSQWQDLKKCAYRLVQRLPANFGKTDEDLFQEALLRTLDGRRKWNMAAVDLFGHLLFAMKGICYGSGQKFYRGEHAFEADNVTHNAEGDEISRLENAPSCDPSADQCISAKDEVERLFGKFREDREATAILQAQREGGATAREIMQEQKLTRRQYEAARRRIRSQKSVLIIEEYDQVLGLFVRLLRAMDFAVVTASTASEGLRLYRKCGPFDVVMMSYSLDLNGVELAMDIRKRNPSQKMIITTTYSCEEDVARPGELAHVPILLKPFGRPELCTILESFANTLEEKPANCFRPKRRRRTTVKMRVPLRTVSASKLLRRDGTLNPLSRLKIPTKE
jgi:CheY-like chemotaxis protein